MVKRWVFDHGHRFTKGEVRRVCDAVNSYAYQWGLTGISPFHEVKRAIHSRHTESGYDGWELLYAEIRPARLTPSLTSEKNGLHLPAWFALRAAGFRPIVDVDGKAWSFRAGTVPLDYTHEIEPLATRRSIAAISRWTWCRACDAELAATRGGWCPACAVAPVSLSSDDLRPVGAPEGYVAPVTL